MRSRSAFLIATFLIFGFGLLSAEERTTTILYLGDSLTEGFGVKPEEAYPALVQKRLKESGFPNVTTINGGYSGSTSASAESRLKWYMRGKPEILVLALGANDGLRGLPPEETKKNLTKAISFARSKGMKVMLCGMMAPPNYGKEYTEKFNRIFPEVAEEESISLLPFLLEDVAGEFDMNLSDGIHPNVKGHERIAETVFLYLKDLLRE